MKETTTPERRRKILKSVYSSTWGTSVIALAMVAVLEISANMSGNTAFFTSCF